MKEALLFILEPIKIALPYCLIVLVFLSCLVACEDDGEED